MPNCTLAPSNIRKKTLFSTVFGWRSLYRIFYWQKFSNNTPFVTCARYNKLYTVLKIKWEIQTGKHLITIQDLHAVIKVWCG